MAEGTPSTAALQQELEAVKGQLESHRKMYVFLCFAHGWMCSTWCVDIYSTVFHDVGLELHKKTWKSSDLAMKACKPKASSCKR